MIGKTIDELRAGDVAELVRRVEPADVAGFVDAVGDHNPIHSDPRYAAGTAFREPIAPGVYTAGLVSAVIGTKLPGPGAIYLSQSLKFIKPVKVGDTITARVTVAEVLGERNRIRLLTVCLNQRDEEVLTGEALVMPSRESIVYERPEPCAGREAPAAALAALVLQPWAWATRAAALWTTLGLAMLEASVPKSPPSLTSTGRR